MDNGKKPIGKDAGYKTIREAMKVLLNQYPGLLPDEEILFETPGEDSGIIFSDNSGALVYAEVEDVIGGVQQTCQYPIFIVYRSITTKERFKIAIQDFLDSLGRWICREPIEINGTDYQLQEYPKVIYGRKINKIVRENSYGIDPQENGVQDWVLPITVQYTNQFEL